MTSKTRKQIITIHKLSNISRRKGNQTIKYGQLTERAEYYSLENM